LDAASRGGARLAAVRGDEAGAGGLAPSCDPSPPAGQAGRRRAARPLAGGCDMPVSGEQRKNLPPPLVCASRRRRRV